MQPTKPKQSKIIRLVVFWALIVSIILVLFAIYSPQQKLQEVAFSDVIRRANNGEIAKLEIEGNNILVTPMSEKDKNQPTQKSYKEDGSSIYEQGLNRDTKAEVVVKEPSNFSGTFWNLAGVLIPTILIAAFFFF